MNFAWRRSPTSPMWREHWGLRERWAVGRGPPRTGRRSPRSSRGAATSVAARRQVGWSRYPRTRRRAAGLPFRASAGPSRTGFTGAARSTPSPRRPLMLAGTLSGPVLARPTGGPRQCRSPSPYPPAHGARTLRAKSDPALVSRSPAISPRPGDPARKALCWRECHRRSHRVARMNLLGLPDGHLDGGTNPLRLGSRLLE